MREIARRLGRDASTISRELRRNAATRGGRWSIAPSVAQWHAERRGASTEGRPSSPRTSGCASTCRTGSPGRHRRRGRPCLVRTCRWNGRRTAAAQDRRWAHGVEPGADRHRLRVDFPDDESMRISPRGDLPGALRPGPWCAAPRADGVPAHRAALRVPQGTHASARQAVRQPEVMISRTAGRSRGPCRAWPLGR